MLALPHTTQDDTRDGEEGTSGHKGWAGMVLTTWQIGFQKVGKISSGSQSHTLLGSCYEKGWRPLLCGKSTFFYKTPVGLRLRDSSFRKWDKIQVSKSQFSSAGLILHFGTSGYFQEKRKSNRDMIKTMVTKTALKRMLFKKNFYH